MSNQDKIELVVSKDGSHTLYVPQLNEHYHSTNGAFQESMHVFISTGFNQVEVDEVNVLEFGFGTGLNAFLTLANTDKKVNYHSMEKYPLSEDSVSLLNYGDLYDSNYKSEFEEMHKCIWERDVAISSTFNLFKQQCDFKSVELEQKYHIIYFDAFAPEKQANLWTKEIFEKAYNALLPGGVLTTYCAKGVVRRTMQEIGFKMECLPGPPGKREMLRATKPY